MTGCLFSFLQTILILNSIVLSSECPQEELIANETEMTIYSPGYPVSYDKYLSCKWLIKTEIEHTVVLLTITDLIISYHVTCGSDSLSIKTGFDGWAHELMNLCGNKTDKLPLEVRSQENEMMLQFRTDGSEFEKGFKATYRIAMKSVTKDKEITMGTIEYTMIIIFAIMSAFIIVIWFALPYSHRRAMEYNRKLVVKQKEDKSIMENKNIELVIKNGKADDFYDNYAYVKIDTSI